MRVIVALSALTVAATVAPAQPPLTVKLSAVDTADYYPWMEQAVAAPTEWTVSATDEATGVRWRLVALRSEIYVSFILERIVVGEEGCCVRHDLSRTFELESVGRYFGLRGELSRLGMLTAPAPRRFQFALEGRTFSLTVVSSEEARLERLPPSR